MHHAVVTYLAATINQAPLGIQDRRLIFAGIQPRDRQQDLHVRTEARRGWRQHNALAVQAPGQLTKQQLVLRSIAATRAPVTCLLPRVSIAAHAPDVLEAARAALEHSQSLQNKTSRQRELDAEAFGSAPDVSIDVALMEKSKQVAVVP